MPTYIITFFIMLALYPEYFIVLLVCLALYGLFVHSSRTDNEFNLEVVGSQAAYPRATVLEQYRPGKYKRSLTLKPVFGKECPAGLIHEEDDSNDINSEDYDWYMNNSVEVLSDSNYRDIRRGEMIYIDDEYFYQNKWHKLTENQFIKHALKFAMYNPDNSFPFRRSLNPSFEGMESSETILENIVLYGRHTPKLI